MRNIILFLAITLFLLAGFYFLRRPKTISVDESKIAQGVDPEEIIDVLPRDAIPAIDNPKFENAEDADKWLKEEEIIFGLVSRGVPKAYPQKILNWHEIVNDPDKITVTFCPLCGSAVAFKSPNTTFGVSGKLYNSDLVMYDRETETLWSQITGEAISGKLVGQKLEMISIQTTTWGEWEKMYPNSQVLSRETGHTRNYEVYPYGNYESSGDVNFPVSGGLDTTIHPKTVVYGVEVDGNFKAYPINKLKVQSEKLKVKDNIGNIAVEFSYDGVSFKIKKLDTGEDLIPIRNFWFAWKSFHPGTELY